MTDENVDKDNHKCNGKVVIITGGAKGIGEGCARVFGRRGFKVVLCDVAKTEGESLAEEITATGVGEAMYVHCDVRRDEDIKAAIETVIKTHGRLDCLINNVGIHPPPLDIDDFSGDDFRDLLNINLVSHFLFCKFSLPHLRKTKGNIINSSSMVAHLGQAGGVTYVATKGAISAMTKALAIDEAKHGVRVNVVAPSNVWTPMWHSIADNAVDHQATIQAGAEAQILGRFGSMEETGQLFYFLATEASFCTGVDVPLSGGAELNYGKKTMLSGSSGSGDWK